MAAKPADPGACYTVDLFTKINVEVPAKDVPEKYSQFLGEWGGGAWNDVWCHSLLINKVYPDGRVELVEMHAPYDPWGQPATAFRRTGHITDDGELRVAYGTETLSYHIDGDGKLEGTRIGSLGILKVTLLRRGVPPVPGRNPFRIAQVTVPAAAAAASPGG